MSEEYRIIEGEKELYTPRNFVPSNVEVSNTEFLEETFSVD